MNLINIMAADSQVPYIAKPTDSNSAAYVIHVGLCIP